jgi:ABC-type amino acid transport substrate-binding protein
MHAYSEKKKKYFRLIILCCTWTFCPQHQNFDAVVGDVERVASRHQYVEFTYPYTETGLVLIVPVRSSNKAWSFIKPFTATMWVLISVITVYNGFVVWWIERKHCDELQGSIPNQIGIMIWLSFNTLFSLNGKLKFLVPISFLL